MPPHDFADGTWTTEHVRDLLFGEFLTVAKIDAIVNELLRRERERVVQVIEKELVLSKQHLANVENWGLPCDKELAVVDALEEVISDIKELK